MWGCVRFHFTAVYTEHIFVEYLLWARNTLCVGVKMSEKIDTVFAFVWSTSKHTSWEEYAGL